jgi:hypothetical protein
MVFLMTIVAAVALVFMVLDAIYWSDGLQNGKSLLGRAAMFAATLAALAGLRRCRTPRGFDRTVLAWVGSVLALQIVVAMLRPAGWSPVHIVNMLIVLGAYTLLPGPTRLTAAPVIAFSLLNLAILVSRAGAHLDRTALATVVAYLVANVLGFLVLRRLQRLRRRHHRILEREREARRKLRAALDEVKVLQGIVPICSICKRVRNDEGLYEAVEAYLARHCEADFSHTLCPECLRDRYPDEARLISR